ncbi:MAG: HEAT repeat domain-containing protein, partial [Planctomycetes bacterium]|nr:HEAT repeat domain-containing protein [Planctomycetota bacterium]
FEDIIIRRYLAERDTEVRACVVRICAPLTSPGSRRMVEFLRARIAAGEFPGYAAIALADIAPRIAFNDIEPLTRHPDPGVRYQAAIALTTLADPRGFEPVARVWRGMEMKNWPDKVEGSNLEEARAALAGRAVRSFGRPLY